MTGNARYNARRKPEIVDFPELLLYVGIAHSFGIKGDDKRFDALCQTFALGNHNGLET